MKNTNRQTSPFGRSTKKKNAGLSLPISNYTKFAYCDMKNGYFEIQALFFIIALGFVLYLFWTIFF